MTLKTLKRRIAELEACGIVDDNTVVCGYNDEFLYLYELDDRHPIVKDVSIDIKDLEDIIEYLKGDDIKNTERTSRRIEETKKEISRLKAFGKTVICLV